MKFVITVTPVIGRNDCMYNHYIKNIFTHPWEAVWKVTYQKEIIYSCYQHIGQALDEIIGNDVLDLILSSSDITDTKEFITDYNKYLDSWSI